MIYPNEKSFSVGKYCKVYISTPQIFNVTIC